MAQPPYILLINPWITDFAAYDLWSKPVGLLLMAALLRDGGCRVKLIDCLNRHDPLTIGRSDVLAGKDHAYGTGKYPRMPLPSPPAYRLLARSYYRYGIHPDSFRNQLEAMPRPDLVMVTSMMTYWYPGVQGCITLVREAFPGVSVWLGGVYARLCPEHARQWSGADWVATGPASRIPPLIRSVTGHRMTNEAAWRSFAAAPSPALDLLPEQLYAPLLTSVGCPFRCPYCASHLLQPVFERRGATNICRDILTWHRNYGIQDFAFYDDALLLDADKTLAPALRAVCAQGLALRFHAPNALHVRALTRERCRLLHESGFTTIRLGLETNRAALQQRWGGKVDTALFDQAVDNLLQAGFLTSQIGVYLLCGVPGQTPRDVAEAIDDVRAAGLLPYLAEYSPIPGTPLWQEVLATSAFDIAREPLYHNNTFFACQREDFRYADLLALKHHAREVRRAALAALPHAPLGADGGP